jgi:2-polyprenyl-3-methyl-5-hydroxy-6-metoxy-1,4-benzoquinol methylase
VAYQHAWTNYGNSVDWMAFIDGDEFLFPTQKSSIQEALAEFEHQPMSALGVYWKCYGSNGHVHEPAGLLMENFPRHSRTEFIPNQHIKSVVRGGAKVGAVRAHLFETEMGTVDEQMRTITSGHMANYQPSYEHLRINHYVTQSLQYFREAKQGIGCADMKQGTGYRPDSWFENHDRNEEEDGVAATLLPRLKEKLMELATLIASPTLAQTPGASSAETRIKPIVRNYQLVKELPPGNYNFTGNSVGLKEIVAHIFADPARDVSLLDIGFGLGELGRIVKTNPPTQHWQVDGIDGFWDSCCNAELFARGHYRNVWHGLAQDLPMQDLRAYDLICLFDVIEHLDAVMAKKLLADLLDSLGPTSKLVISTPLWFWPQAHQNAADLEEHLIGIPAQSLLALAPVMYHIHPKFLVGTFVLTRASIPLIDHFVPISDPNFNWSAGMAHLESLGQKADGVLYIQPGALGTPTQVVTA